MSQTPPSLPDIVKSNESGRISLAFTVLLGIAFFSSIEILGSVLFAFRKYKGRYIYCMLIASLGILVYSIFNFTLLYALLNPYVSVACGSIGWIFMVTGQALVLHSRLHLIVKNRTKVKWVLIMICTNAICVHLAQTGLALKVNLSFSHPSTTTTNKAHQAVEMHMQGKGKYTPWIWGTKISTTVFTLQDFLISSLYIFESHHVMQAGSTLRGKTCRLVMHHLILANIFIISLDALQLAFEWTELYTIYPASKPVLYALKLKLAFRVLNNLTDFTNNLCNNNKQRNGAGGGSRSFKPTTSISASLYGKELAQRTPDGQILRATQVIVQNCDVLYEQEGGGGCEKRFSAEEYSVYAGDENMHMQMEFKQPEDIDFVCRGP